MTAFLCIPFLIDWPAVLRVLAYLHNLWRGRPYGSFLAHFGPVPLSATPRKKQSKLKGIRDA